MGGRMIEKTVIIRGHNYTIWGATEEEIETRISALNTVQEEEHGDHNI